MIWNSVDVKLWFVDVKVIVVNVFHQSFECWMVGFPRFSHVLFFSRASHVWFWLGKVQGGVPVSLAKLICNFIVPMVRRFYGWYISTYMVYKPTNVTEGHHLVGFIPFIPPALGRSRDIKRNKCIRWCLNDPETAPQIERKAMFTALH